MTISYEFDYIREEQKFIENYDKYNREYYIKYMINLRALYIKFYAYLLK